MLHPVTGMALKKKVKELFTHMLIFFLAVKAQVRLAENKKLQNEIEDWSGLAIRHHSEINIVTIQCNNLLDAMNGL